jgi:hypothetical protein
MIGMLSPPACPGRPIQPPLVDQPARDRELAPRVRLQEPASRTRRDLRRVLADALGDLRDRGGDAVADLVGDRPDDLADLLPLLLAGQVRVVHHPQHLQRRALDLEQRRAVSFVNATCRPRFATFSSRCDFVSFSIGSERLLVQRDAVLVGPVELLLQALRPLGEQRQDRLVAAAEQLLRERLALRAAVELPEPVASASRGSPLKSCVPRFRSFCDSPSA